MASPPPPPTAPGFPAPPPFYQSFTPSNLAHLRALTTTSTTSSSNVDDTSTAEDPIARKSNPSAQLAISFQSSPPPAALRHLLPPPPPPEGRYKLFGETRSLKPSLPAAAAPPSPTDAPLDPSATTSAPAATDSSPAHLIHLTRSLLLSFLSFLHLLALDPSAPHWAPKWEDLRALFGETYATLGAWRGWQAGEALIAVLEEMAQKGREEVQRVKELEVAAAEWEAEGKEAWGGLAAEEMSDEKSEEKEWNAKIDEEKWVWELLDADS